MDIRTMACDLCKKSSPVSDMRYMLRSGKRMALCQSCRGRTEGAAQPQVTIKKEVKKLATKQPYFCAQCRYKFKADAGYGTPKCPYCGKTNKVTEVKETSADELLKEVTDA